MSLELIDSCEWDEEKILTIMKLLYNTEYKIVIIK